jgi:16S rRNA (adenine1518-N6/adenine1519-N6)-dimethyltransferase
VDAIAPSPTDRFLEIGPGPGVLTERLAARAAKVIAVEIDRNLAATLAPRLPSNVEIVTGDILDVDLSSFVRAGAIRVAGNLPYNISSPILFKLLRMARESSNLTDATVMLQREVADRLVSPPGTRDYGVLTIFTALQADVERLLTLPPGAFRPAPRVHSAVVRLTFKPTALPDAAERHFERLVRIIFMQRRKTLLNALRPYAESVRRDAASALSAASIDAGRRPETLDLPELFRLASVFSHEP